MLTSIGKVSNSMKISLRPNRITKLVSNGGQISLENGLFFNSHHLVFTHFLKHYVHFFHLINEENFCLSQSEVGLAEKQFLCLYSFLVISLSL